MGCLCCSASLRLLRVFFSLKISQLEGRGRHLQCTTGVLHKDCCASYTDRAVWLTAGTTGYWPGGHLVLLPLQTRLCVFTPVGRFLLPSPPALPFSAKIITVCILKETQSGGFHSDILTHTLTVTHPDGDRHPIKENPIHVLLTPFSGTAQEAERCRCIVAEWEHFLCPSDLVLISF